MAADELEVFDFSSEEFTKIDLINALDEMVIEYKKLSDSFNEINLKNTADSKTFETIETKDLKNRVDELTVENEKLTAIVQDTSLEIKCLNYVINAWTKSSADLKWLHEQQRPAGCKFGLGFTPNSTDESNIKLTPKNKLKRISFVKERPADESADHKEKDKKCFP